MPSMRGDWFKAEFPKHWEALKAVRSLKSVPQEQLAAMVEAVVQLGQKLRNRPTYEGPVRKAVAATEQAIVSLNEVMDRLQELRRNALEDYDECLFHFAGPTLLEPDLEPIPALLFSIRSLELRLRLARLILGKTMSVDLSPSEAMKIPRRVPTAFIDPITELALNAWKQLVGRPVVSAKGLSPDGPFGKRPARDDAFFVYLCLNAAVDIDAVKAITAIRRIQEKKPNPSTRRAIFGVASAILDLDRKDFGHRR